MNHKGKKGERERGGGGGGWFFFFKQKTAYEMCGRDWSSNVCSSDLSYSLPLCLSIQAFISLIQGKKYRFVVVAVYSGQRTADSEPSRRLKLDPNYADTSAGESDSTLGTKITSPGR